MCCARNCLLWHIRSALAFSFSAHHLSFILGRILHRSGRFGTRSDSARRELSNDVLNVFRFTAVTFLFRYYSFLPFSLNPHVFHSSIHSVHSFSASAIVRRTHWSCPTLLHSHRTFSPVGPTLLCCLAVFYLFLMYFGS